MSFYAFVRRSLRYYRLSGLAVVAGVCVATAVLVGSLLVGDSVGGSLRALALERLGRTDWALTSARFLPQRLADDLRNAPGVRGELAEIVPCIILEGSAADPSRSVSVPDVTVIGLTDDFLRLGSNAPGPLSGRQVGVNRSLAEDLGIAAGQDLIVTVGRRGTAPVDTAFGRRTRQDTVQRMRVTVGSVIPDDGLGRFSLQGGRPRARNLYVALDFLQEQLKQTERINTLLVAAKSESAVDLATLQSGLADVVGPVDYGLEIDRKDERGYVVLRGRDLLLPDFVLQAASTAARGAGLHAATCSVYLANDISVVGRDGASIPYSIVVAIEPVAALGPLVLADGSTRETAIGPAEILLNAWAAENLGARSGDLLQLSFYVAGPFGELTTVSRTFTLAGVLAMDGPGMDPGLVPDFEGMTDAENMSDWRPPFPIDLGRIRPTDEDYWHRYRTTPKAMLSASVLRELWTSRLPASAGQPAWVTALALTPEKAGNLAALADDFRARLRAGLRPESAGLVFQPVRAQALDAARGTTDYGMLFLSMSMFLVAAAAILVGLLLRLTVERRAAQIGMMLATGFTPRRTACVLFAEAMSLAVLGTLVGLPVGILYAWGTIFALRTLWAGAVAEFPLWLYVTVPSLAIGAVSGLFVSALAVCWALRALRRRRAVELLAGWRALAARHASGAGRLLLVFGTMAIVAAVALLVLAGAFSLLAAAPAFFAGGSLLLVGVLSVLAAWLQRVPADWRAADLSLRRLAMRGARLNWVRSLLVVGVLAVTSLLLVTVAAFHRDPTLAHPGPADSGTGGYNLVVTCKLPVYQDLNSETGRRALGLSDDARALLNRADVIPFRVSDGEDISCLNIQRAVVPRLMGVPQSMIERDDFSFAADETPEPAGKTDIRDNPWRLLNVPLPDDVIPAFADADTAQWSLHRKMGEEFEVPGPSGRSVRVRLVGLLKSSIFASELLVSEENFTRHFGAESGYRYFLIKLPVRDEAPLAQALRRDLGDFGVDVMTTSQLLASYWRVQNTYLSTFQTLGGLGLVLGTFGLVTVLLRNIVERRSELAMMLALGFTRARLVAMVVLENAALLVLGVVIGTVSALVAAGPQILSAGSGISWEPLATTLLAAVVVGVISCALAAHFSVRRELLPALRSE